MIKNIKILPPLVPVVILFFLECFIVFPDFFYLSLVFINLFIAHAAFQITKQSRLKEKWYNFFILPAWFTTSAAAYSILFVNFLLIQFIFVLAAVFSYFYFRQIYYYLILPKNYKENALENFASYGNFLAMFFAFSVAYGLQSFLGVSVTLLALVMAPLIWLVSYQVIWANRIEMREGAVFILINTLVLVELFWAVSFLPQSYSTVGLIMAICYYMMTGIVRFSLNQNLQGVRSKSKQYLFFGVACIVIILLTSKWI